MRRVALLLGLLLATSGVRAGNPVGPNFYPNEEYRYDFANPQRFSANAQHVNDDAFFRYPHAKPAPVVTHRFGGPSARYPWGYFGAKQRRAPVYHQSANEHYEQVTVRRGP